MCSLPAGGVASLPSCKGSTPSGTAGSGGSTQAGGSGVGGAPGTGGRTAGSGGQAGASASGGLGPAGTGGTVGPAGTGGTVSDAGSDASSATGRAPANDAGGDAGTAACNQPVADPYAVSIAGQWDFTPQGGAATKIQVPGGGWIKQGFTAPSATYARTITVPDSGAPQTTLLEFGTINHQATLTVGTTLVGTNTTAFTPSVFDITRFVTAGQQVAISLLVKGRDALTSANGRLVPTAANWSPNVPQGIFRSAMIRVYPDVYISDAFVRTSVSGDSLTYDVSITNTGTDSWPAGSELA